MADQTEQKQPTTPSTPRVDPLRDRCADAAGRVGCRDLLLAMQKKGMMIYPGIATLIQGAIVGGFRTGWDVALQVADERVDKGGSVYDSAIDGDPVGVDTAGVN